MVVTKTIIATEHLSKRT